MKNTNGAGFANLFTLSPLVRVLVKISLTLCSIQRELERIREILQGPSVEGAGASAPIKVTSFKEGAGKDWKSVWEE